MKWLYWDVERECARQTGYRLNDDGSWSPHDKPHVKDWDLAVQVIKAKLLREVLVCTVIALGLLLVAIEMV